MKKISKKRSIVDRADSKITSHSLTPSQLEERRRYCSSLAGMLPGFVGNLVRENPQFCENLYTKHLQTTSNATQTNQNSSSGAAGIIGRLFHRVHHKGSQLLMNTITNNKSNDSTTATVNKVTTSLLSSNTSSKLSTSIKKSIWGKPSVGVAEKRNNPAVRLRIRNPEIINDEKNVVITEEPIITTILSGTDGEISKNDDVNETISILSQPINVTISMEKSVADIENLTSPHSIISSVTSSMPMTNSPNSSNIDLVMETSSIHDTPRVCNMTCISPDHPDIPSPSINVTVESQPTIEFIGNDMDRLTGNVTSMPSLDSINNLTDVIPTSIIEESSMNETAMTIDTAGQIETQQVDHDHVEETQSITNDLNPSSDRRIDEHSSFENAAAYNNMTKKEMLDRLSVLMMNLRLGFDKKRPSSMLSSSNSPSIDSKSINNDRVERMHALVEEIDELENTLSTLKALKTSEVFIEH